MAGANGAGLSTNGSSADLEHFFQTLWRGKATGVYYRLCWKSPAGQFSSGRWFQKNQLKTELLECIEAHAGDNIYWQCAGSDHKSPKKEGTLAPGFLWVDMDGGAGPADVVPLPTMAWETSAGKWQGVWIISDGYMTEDLNKRLTYYLRADRACWKQNQVLRVPGTVNYGDARKGLYLPPHHGRMIWSDGPVYTLNDLENMIPPLDDGLEDDLSGVEKDTQEAGRGAIPPRVRKKLERRPNASEEKSDQAYAMVCNMIEVGVSDTDIHDALKGSGWVDKFEKRGPDGLLRQIRAIRSRHAAHPNVVRGEGRTDRESRIAAVAKKAKEKIARGADSRWYKDTVWLKDIKMNDSPWYWFPYIRSGELTIIAGHGESGKTFLSYKIMKTIMDGDLFPGQPKRVVDPGVGLVFSRESSRDSVRDRFCLVNLHNVDSCAFYDRAFSLKDKDDRDALIEYCVQIQPRIILFDALNAYLSGVNMDKMNEVSDALGGLTSIARLVRCPILCLHHLTKSSEGKSRDIDRLTGSVAFSAYARNTLMVSEIGPGENAFWSRKANDISVQDRPDAQVFKFSSGTKIKRVGRGIIGRRLTRGKLVGHVESLITWGGERSDLDMNECLKNNRRFTKSSLKNKIVLWIEAKLVGGPVLVKDLVRQARADHINERTLQRAFKGMMENGTGVRIQKGMRASWKWALGTRH